jgi:hypothetical protein
MGTYSLKNIYNVLKDTHFYTDNQPYIFYKLDKKDFVSLIQKVTQHQDMYSEVLNDKDELTVILPKKVWESDFSAEFTPLKTAPDIALITCELQQESQGGFLLPLVTMLSTHSISVYVQTSFTQDHIFVNFEQLEEALRLLNQLKG